MMARPHLKVNRFASIPERVMQTAPSTPPHPTLPHKGGGLSSHFPPPYWEVQSRIPSPWGGGFRLLSPPPSWGRARVGGEPPRKRSYDPACC